MNSFIFAYQCLNELYFLFGENTIGTNRVAFIAEGAVEDVGAAKIRRFKLLHITMRIKVFNAPASQKLAKPNKEHTTI
jgi:hypothetical protein